MNCQNHPETPATAYCRTCGKPVCDECRRDAYGTVFCAEHAPAPAPAAPPPAAGPRQAAAGPPPTYVYSDVSPGLAFFLGWIPGVGAIYNGQYAKGLVHAVIFGILCSIVDNARGLEPLFGILIAVWLFYMAFEAYHTARKRRMGEPVDEYSSLINLRGQEGQFPVAGVVLIALGVLLLLHTLDLLDFYYVARYWPVLLILAGVYMLYSRFAGHGSAPKEIGHERQ
ncbi:MAG: B-box zinc finger protein [Acidobacteriia bacterium]|nr:B-box zinc finger protein [Terriglobia bacterium]